MLVITRSLDEEIIIGDGEGKVVIKVLRVKKKVKLGVTAPQNLLIELGEKPRPKPNISVFSDSMMPAV